MLPRKGITTNAGHIFVIKRLVALSLRYRGAVLALAALLIIYGGYRLTRTQYDVFPQFAPPQVTIQAEAPGLSPRAVEQLITTPIESAVNATPGIQSLRSGSVLGLSVITVTFQPNTNIYRDRQVIAERLATISSQLPAGTKPPVMTPLTSSTGKVMVLGLTSKTRSLMAVHTFARWTMWRRLLAVKGVAKVVVFGGQVRQLQIQIDPHHLVRDGLSIKAVTDAARRATGIRGAGFIDTHNQRIALQTMGQALTSSALGEITLTTRHGVPVTLRDIARVKFAPAPPVGAALINGRPGVMLIIAAQYGANTRQVTRRLDKALQNLAPALTVAHIQLTRLFRPANFIRRAMNTLRSNLALGGVFVAIVLLLFLFNLRTSVISLLAIPLSLLTATLVLEMLGFSLNTMTLGGLAIAVGLLVDDAVITVENIYRRLRENQTKTKLRPVLRVIRDATLEVRSAVVYATFAIAMVFIPILTLPGVTGRLFGPLADAYILATLASLGVALTVTPALCYVLLARDKIKAQEPPLVTWLQPRYEHLLTFVERRYRTTIVVILLASVAGLAALPFFSLRFIPPLREGHYIVHMMMTAGSSLNQSLQLGKILTHKLLQLPSVRAVGQKVGRAPLANDILGTNRSEFEVDLKPLDGAQSEVARRKIQEILTQIPGASLTLKTFLSERIEETISGQTAPVVIHIFGKRLDTLNHIAEKVVSALRQVPGASSVRLQSQPDMPQLKIRLRPKALTRWGFHPLDVLDTLHTAYGGNIVGQIYDSGQAFNVVVILAPRYRANIANVSRLLLKSSSGIYVPLHAIAHVYEATGPKTILHEGGRRVATVTADVIGHNAAAFVAAAKKRIRQMVRLPAGTYLDYVGTTQAQTRSLRQLLFSALIAIALIALLLSQVLARPRNLILILLNLPFALVGGVFAALGFLGGALTMGSMVGFVTLFGITLRNAIMLISHYEHLVQVEGILWGPQTAIRGAQERLTPILMTALVTAFGLLPLAFARGAPGNAIVGPMAIVILGGLVTSTALNLLVMPALALRYGRFTKSQKS